MSCENFVSRGAPKEGGNSDMFCQKCGTQIGEGAEFCQKCGTKIMDNNTTSQETELSDRQTAVTTDNTKATPQKAVKAGKLQKFAMARHLCG